VDHDGILVAGQAVDILGVRSPIGEANNDVAGSRSDLSAKSVEVLLYRPASWLPGDDIGLCEPNLELGAIVSAGFLDQSVDKSIPNGLGSYGGVHGKNDRNGTSIVRLAGRRGKRKGSDEESGSTKKKPSM
jgi:hypothetical protein